MSQVGASKQPDQGNPALRMLGVPRKLPSRRWMIFFGVVGAWTSALVYDRYQKKRVQAKWANYVSHLADEPLGSRSMQRRITILLAAPPHDGLRAAREHFHEYIKPILVAAAIDWEVIEGRREGEVQAGLAEKIRKMREEKGEPRKEDSEIQITPADAVTVVRKSMGIEEFDGLKGDLVVGRHTWKEYIRGLHEGWLGPMDPPIPDQVEAENTGHVEAQLTDNEKTTAENEEPEADDKPEEKPKSKDPEPPTPPYIFPSSYPASTLASTCPSTFEPSIAVPLPHVLGILNTPKRMYRFLRRRHLADSTGASIAALVIATQTRPYHPPAHTNPDEASDPDSTPLKWEQDLVLAEAEAEWHKSARAENKEGEPDKERPWKEDMVIDTRIGERMRLFELPEGADKEAEAMAEKARSEQESLWSDAVKWAGFGPKERGGWDMGLEGGEDD